MQFPALFEVCFQLRPYITYLHRTVLTWGGGLEESNKKP